MEIRVLEYFITAYESKSFTKAAKKLHLTQQGISKAVGGLEKEFGAPLFIREKMSLEPTEFGTIFYNKTKQLLDEYQNTIDSLRSIAREKSELRIGFGSNVMPALNAETIITDFKRQYPSVTLNILNLMDYECEEALLSHKIDVAFTMGPFSSSRITSFLLASEAIHALLSINHPLAARDSLTVEDLCHEPLITADSRSKGYARTLSLFQEKCSHINIIFQTNDPVVHLHMASKQMGISLFPNHLRPVFEQAANVRILPITDFPYRHIYLVSEPQALKSLNVKQFVKFTTQFFKNTPPFPN